MIGRGMTVRRAMMEMEMVTEGYYAAKCLHEINADKKVPMPVMEGVFDILYRDVPIQKAIDKISIGLI